MNPQSNQDLQHRLQTLEEEINSSNIAVRQSQEIIQSSQLGFPNIYVTATRLINWFANLPGIGKLIVIGVAVVFSFAMLQAVLKLVASVISVTLLAVLVYVGYKFIVSTSLEHKQ
jgi:hypothetical protein